MLYIRSLVLTLLSDVLQATNVRRPVNEATARTDNCVLRAQHLFHCICMPPMLNSLDNLYIPTSSLAICFSVLEDSGSSAETCFDTERRACPQPAAFFSRRTRITPSTYVYTSFVSDLVLAKSVAIGKTPRQTSLFARLLYWSHIAWARCHHYEI